MAWQYLAGALSQLGHGEEAVAIYRELVSAHPQDPVVWYQLGRVLEWLRRSDEALAALTEAIALQPRSGAFHYHMGRSLQSLERAEEAAAAYERALRHDPTLLEAYPALIQTLAELRQWERRRNVAKQWTEIAQSAEAAHALGTSLMMVGDFDEAKTALEEAHQLDPAPEIAADLATVMQECGDTIGAEKLLRDNLLKHPNDVMLWESLAFVLLNDERYAEALGAARAAVAKDPTRPGPHDVMASILARTGEPDEGLSELDTALRLNPNLLEYHAKRGAVLNQLGRHPEALDEFDFVIEADPAFFTGWSGRPFLPAYEASKAGKIADKDAKGRDALPPAP